ncbi:hypothetical protein [Avrilella dinanensis]|uniref:Uncharacterized protein n=1 Tax=Avrilella dinanensis TaxID=2008672 RepID=A0A2M9R5J8_9FLAO|nr:hypothetical protein [Avrilella dinanensis]PJR04035.1 hypothetical protein CDL10_05470 [Avrilella dinanensis]
MKWYEVIGLIGSIVSIGAAIYTYRYSTIIKKTKDEIFGLFKAIKFSSINENTTTTIEQIKKIAHRQKIARGTNIDEIINSLNLYFEKIFKLKNEKEVEESSKLNLLIDNYRQKVVEITNSRNDETKLIQCFNEIYELTLTIDQEFGKLTKKIVEK